jgi:hypothetical protein
MSKEFPAYVFKDTGPHQRAGGTYDHKVVEDQDQFDAALADGWFPSLPEALGIKSDVQEGTQKPSESSGQVQDQGSPDTAPPTRAELEAKATELGIKFGKKTADDDLAAQIQAALGA